MNLTDIQHRIMRYLEAAGPSTVEQIVEGLGMSYLERKRVGTNCTSLGKQGLLDGKAHEGKGKNFLNRTKQWSLVSVKS